MIRPHGFGYNPETAESNHFQQKTDVSAEAAQLEFDKMVELLEAHGVKVRVFDDLQSDLTDSVFPNNWITQIPGKCVVVFPMEARSRRREIREDVIRWLSTTTELEILDLSSKASEGIYLEGTGSIVFDHENRTAYACESSRTNLNLLSELCYKIGYDPVSFRSVDVNGNEIYHTNVMMSVAEEFAVVCLESIENAIERSLLRRKLEADGKEIIEISYPQMNSFAGNCFEVAGEDGSCLILSQTAFQSLKTEQIKTIEKHCAIIHPDIHLIESAGGGSVRCMVAGLFI